MRKHFKDKGENIGWMFEKKENTMTNLILFIGVHGKKLGWTLLLSPIIWDIVMYATRSHEEIRIEIGGVVIIIFGALLIASAKKIDRSLK